MQLREERGGESVDGYNLFRDWEHLRIEPEEV
jgi:hypothetical protein